jgi:PRTRC genetic system protein B
MDYFKVRAMQAYVNIGANIEFRLSEAVLVYRGGGDGAFASLHRVKQAENGIPYLTPGEALTTAFLGTLAQGLGAQVKPEILPDNVLARTPDMLVWWSRPQRRVIFFGGVDEEARKLNGLLFPHPALIFKVAGRDLFVRAVAGPAGPAVSLRRNHLSWRFH